MIRSQHSSLIRMLLLAFTLGVTLSACASDGRLDVKNLDLAKLKFKQPNWMRWDRDTKPAAASPQPQTAQKTAPDIAAAPDNPTNSATSPSVTARPRASYSAYSANAARSTYAPRPKPERPPARLTKSSPLPPPKARLAEIKEQPAKAPQGKVTTAIPEALAVLPPPGKPPRAEGKGGYSINDLVGLDGPAVERLLGKPDLSRKEPFAEVWQYAHGDCVLFLFIYAEAGGAARVSHAETGARDGGPDPEPGQCIGAILSRNAAVPG